MYQLLYLASRRSPFALWKSRKPSLLHDHTYSTVLAPRQRRTVRVPVGGSGHVELHISPPLNSPAKPSYSPILICLPTPNALFANQTPQPAHDVNQTTLLSSLLPSATIVALNYRLESVPSPLAYPIAIHDVATGFSYIKSSLVSRDQPRPKICLYGSHIGGALATMLALTQPNDILALAVSEPLVDWVGLDDYAVREKPTGIQKSKKLAISEFEVRAAKSLTELRSKLFRNPGLFFDPFASPTLFLRAPGRDTPASYSMDDNPDYLLPLPEAFGPYDDDIPSYSPHSAADTAIDTDEPPAHSTHPKRRKVLQRWPPTAARPETVLLPHTRILIHSPSPTTQSNPEHGLQAVLGAQGTEIVELMRRACFMGRERGFAEERVQLEMMDAGEVESKEVALERVAVWLRKKFEEDE